MRDSPTTDSALRSRMTVRGSPSQFTNSPGRTGREEQGWAGLSDWILALNRHRCLESALHGSPVSPGQMPDDGNHVHNTDFHQG